MGSALDRDLSPIQVSWKSLQWFLCSWTSWQSVVHTSIILKWSWLLFNICFKLNTYISSFLFFPSLFPLMLFAVNKKHNNFLNLFHNMFCNCSKGTINVIIVSLINIFFFVCVCVCVSDFACGLRYCRCGWFLLPSHKGSPRTNQH